MGEALSGTSMARGSLLRIVFIEDNPADAELCLRELKKAGFDVSADLVQTPEEFTQRISSKPYDMVLADFRLPRWTGMDALEIMQELGKDIPLILVTGALGEETAVECIKKGASDYVLKDRLTRLPVAVSRAMEEKNLREDRKRAEEALQQFNTALTGWLKEQEKRIREARLLIDMSDLLRTCATAGGAYAVIGRFAKQLFPAGSGALGVLNTSQNAVEEVAVWGASTANGRVFTPEECWALRRGQMHVIEDPAVGPLCQHLELPLSGGYLCIPLMAQGETLGLLHLREGMPGASTEGQLSEARQRLAVMVAGCITLSLANLRLREIVRLQSIRDPLTGLFNRRYMEESLVRELRRAGRAQRKLGVIMFDLDHLQLYNDTFGHDAGDALLRELGNFLKTHTRGEDIACRYGGAEFALILPEASIEATRQRAEQLRKEFKDLIAQNRLQSRGAVTLSIGVVVFPEHGSTAEQILHAADRALYRAKSEGRDRVVLGEAID